MAFIEGCPHIRGGRYRGVSSHAGMVVIEGCPHMQGWLL